MKRYEVLQDPDGLNLRYYQIEAIQAIEKAIALMNAMLHDIDGKIYLCDTLSNQGKVMKDFDVVLANPPFGTKKRIMSRPFCGVMKMVA